MDNKQMISNTDHAFLQLLRAAIHQQSAELPEQTDWNGVFQLAQRQRVLPLILESTWKYPSIPEDVLSFARFKATETVILQVRKTAAFLDLYRYLSESGVCPLVLKGLICRSLYPKPDGRPSGDEDLLIRPEEFKTVHEALLKYGLQCDDLQPSSTKHEVAYTGRELRIELHLSCFPEDSEAYGNLNRLFTGCHERSVSFETEGVALRTMSADDHLLYLICHAYKHFLHSGVGIRQVCDIVVFAECYKKDIDWNELRKKCDSIRISLFTSALFRIGERHLGFSVPGAFADLETDETDLLNDILSGGIYGATEANRQHSSTITLAAVEAQKKGKGRSGVLASVFLPLNSMERKYPYLKERPWLLPAAWTQRILGYLSKREKNTDPAESIRIGRERIELLKKYGIIDS